MGDVVYTFQLFAVVVVQVTELLHCSLGNDGGLGGGVDHCWPLVVGVGNRGGTGSGGTGFPSPSLRGCRFPFRTGFDWWWWGRGFAFNNFTFLLYDIDLHIHLDGGGLGRWRDTLILLPCLSLGLASVLCVFPGVVLLLFVHLDQLVSVSGGTAVAGDNGG